MKNWKEMSLNIFKVELFFLISFKRCCREIYLYYTYLCAVTFRTSRIHESSIDDSNVVSAIVTPIFAMKKFIGSGGTPLL